MESPNVEPAEFGIRLAGRLIDYAVVFLAAGIAFAMLGILAEMFDPRAAKGVGDAAYLRVSLLFGLILYHTLSESIGGASLGKRILGLEVVSNETLHPATIGQTWKRNLGFLIDSFFFGLIGYNAMRKNPERQRLGDQYGDTRVVRRRSLPAALRRPTRIFFFVFLGAFFLGVEGVMLIQTLGYWLFA